VQPPGYLRRVREACDRHDAFLICDEVATGFGRTGTMFACEQEGVIPDLLTVSKHFGGGIEISAVITSPEIEGVVADRGLVIGHSHTNDPLPCNAAIASLDVIVSGNLPDRAQQIGKYWRTKLEALMAKYPKPAAVVAEQPSVQVPPVVTVPAAAAPTGFGSPPATPVAPPAPTTGVLSLRDQLAARLRASQAPTGQ